MSKYLIKTTEQWRVDTEAEAKAIIEAAKAEKRSILTKYSSEYKEKKVKGEVEDSWFRVTLNKSFTDEKEPDCTTTIEYQVELGAFPNPVDMEDEDENED